VYSLNSTSIQTLVSTTERVLLQTTTVPIQSSDESKTISVKVLLDSASHWTFMTDSLAQKLQLAPLYKEALTVSTFAARKPHVVSCNLGTKDRCCLQLHANVIKQITGPVQQRSFAVSRYGYFAIYITTQVGRHNSVNLVMWTYWLDLTISIGTEKMEKTETSIIDMEKTTLPSGLFPVSSRFGYILTGNYSYPITDGSTHS